MSHTKTTKALFFSSSIPVYGRMNTAQQNDMFQIIRSHILFHFRNVLNDINLDYTCLMSNIFYRYLHATCKLNKKKVLFFLFLLSVVLWMWVERGIFPSSYTITSYSLYSFIFFQVMIFVFFFSRAIFSETK